MYVVVLTSYTVLALLQRKSHLSPRRFIRSRYYVQDLEIVSNTGYHVRRVGGIVVRIPLIATQISHLRGCLGL